MQDFRRLAVWTKAHELTVRVYRTTSHLPRRGHANLSSQLRRAAIGISANIAEGCGHRTNREFARFLQIAMASANELEYHLLLAADLELVTGATHVSLEDDLKQVKRMLAVLIHRVRGDDSNGE
jgi:four helix bundle protein